MKVAVVTRIRVPAWASSVQSWAALRRRATAKCGLTLMRHRETYSGEVARKPAMSMTRAAVNQMNSMGIDEIMTHHCPNGPAEGPCNLVAGLPAKVQGSAMRSVWSAAPGNLPAAKKWPRQAGPSVRRKRP